MARGMVVGETISTVAQAVGPEYRERFEATFGERPESRGRWIWSKKLGKLVRPEEYEPEETEQAMYAPIISGRLHEGAVAPDGTDIGTRARRRAWMREHDVVDYADGKSLREKRRKMEADRKAGRFAPDRELRDMIGKKLYDAKLNRP